MEPDFGIYLLDIDPDARVYEVDNQEDFNFLRENFPASDSYGEDSFGREEWASIKSRGSDACGYTFIEEMVPALIFKHLNIIPATMDLG